MMKHGRGHGDMVNEGDGRGRDDGTGNEDVDGDGDGDVAVENSLRDISCTRLQCREQHERYQLHSTSVQGTA